MTKLEPIIYETLIDLGGPIHKNILIERVEQKIHVDKKKISFRIDKLVSLKKLESDNDVISFLEKKEFPSNLDESYEYGPIKLAKKGRQVFTQSNWDKEDFKKYKEKIKEKLPELDRNIKEKLKEIETKIMDEFDPLDVLAYISYTNILKDPDISESAFEGKQLLPEIIQNIILKNPIAKYKNKIGRDNIPDMEKMLKPFLSDLIWFIMYNTMHNESLSDVEKEVYVKTVIRHLIVRGDAYPSHYKLIATEFFNNFQNEFSKLGFDVNDYYKTIDEINRQILYNYNDVPKKLRDGAEDLIQFIKQKKQEDADFDLVLEEYRENVANKEEFQKIGKKLFEICFKGSFEIEINDNININLLDYISLKFGETYDWKNVLDKDRTLLKPVINVDEKYYCFLLPHLIRNAFLILENAILIGGFNENKYSKKKSKYFENKAVDLFSNMIQTDVSYKGLFYKIVEDGKEKKPEIDGIVIKGKTLLLIEVKGKNRRNFGGRKDILTILEGDVKKSVTEAFEQTKRTYKYISENETSQFFDSSNKKVLELKKKSFDNVFLIIVTSDSFSDFSTDLNLLKIFRKKRLSGTIYPYIISIYDLLVLSDFIETPKDLIDYLKQRIEINNTYELKSGDELDFLGYFLRHGNLKSTDDMGNIKHSIIHSYSEDIDKWYLYLDGEIKNATKPIRKR